MRRLFRKDRFLDEVPLVTTPVQDIIVYRYDRRLITVLSSNLDDDGLLAKYGSRVLDRLGESYTRIAYTQSSYRELE